MIARKLISVCSLSALALITACSANPPRNDSTIGDARGGINNAQQFGNVSGIEVVPVANRSSGGGALLGAVIGGVLGNQVGSGTGRAVATGVGVVGGAAVGNNIESRNKTDGEFYRVSVRFDNGVFGHFDYQRIDDLRVGDRVKVEGGQLSRV